MFDHKSITLKHKSLISFVLCMALILNTGCQSSQQKTVSLQKDNIENTTLKSKSIEIAPKVSDPQNQSKKSHDIDKAQDNMWEFITETANSVSYIPIAGAAVAAICLNYESWRTLCEAF
jgi:phage-related tail protein